MISQEKKGRMRPATCWRATCWRRRWKLLSAQHKDRSLILALQGAKKDGVIVVSLFINHYNHL